VLISSAEYQSFLGDLNEAVNSGVDKRAIDLSSVYNTTIADEALVDDVVASPCPHSVYVVKINSFEEVADSKFVNELEAMEIPDGYLSVFRARNHVLIVRRIKGQAMDWLYVKSKSS
jgi:hypothetical protein